jgi:hypothetical protein
MCFRLLPGLTVLSQRSYTPVAVGIVFVLVLAVWFLSARKWYTGPLPHLIEVGAVDPNILAKESDGLSGEKLKDEKVAVKVV